MGLEKKNQRRGKKSPFGIVPEESLIFLACDFGPKIYVLHRLRIRLTAFSQNL